MKPYEIVAAPYTAFVAPAQTAAPKLILSEKEIVEKEATLKFKKVGTSGNLNYSEAGVTVTQSQTIATFQSAGSTVPRKAWRTDEGLEVAFELADVSPTQYAMVMDNLTVTTRAGVTGTGGNYEEEEFNLFRGTKVYAYALYLRGISSLEESLPSAYYIPCCYQGGNPALKYALKGGPAMLALQFIVLEQEAGNFGSLQVAKGPQ